MSNPNVAAFFDDRTNTVSYVVSDPATQSCALIDTVLDYDPDSGNTSTTSADAIIAHVREHDLIVKWILETHAHADHFTAAPYLQDQLGGVIAIILLSCMGAFLLADKIERLLGETAQLVITRLLGVLLAALSVQFVADGILAFIRT